MADISLTASMRSNLLSLQNTQDLMDMTQERLSTGKKVNSAIDNPSSYYTAQSLTNRASDLSSLLDSMGQAIQTIQAADEGIEAITDFADQAKAVANSARDSSEGDSVANYVEQFNSILDQIDQLAKDSSYKGVNLLNGDDLTVIFNEDRSSKLEISGVHADTSEEGLAIDRAVAGAAGDTTWTEKVNVGTKATEYDSTSTTQITANSFVVYNGSLYQATKAVGDGAAAVGEFDASKFKLISSDADTVAKATAADFEAFDVNVVSDATKEAINTSITQVEAAISKLRTMASEFGNNYSIVQNREDFTENLINVLEEGADKLTLADMNEESANMLALQTRQQLAINSLSLASQAAQSVLSLF